MESPIPFVSKPLRPGQAVELYRSSQLSLRPEFQQDANTVGIIGLFNDQIPEPKGFPTKRELDDYRNRVKVPLYPFQTVPSVILSFSGIATIEKLEEITTCTMRALLFRPNSNRETSFRRAMWGILQYVEAKFYFRIREEFQDWRQSWVQVYDRYDRVLMFDLIHNGQFIFVGRLNSWRELDPDRESTYGLVLYTDLLLLLMQDFNIDPGQILHAFYLLYPGAPIKPTTDTYPVQIFDATPFEVFGY